MDKKSGEHLLDSEKARLSKDDVISHDFEEETPEAKARWFQSLPLSTRMEMLCLFTDLILSSNPNIVELRDAKPGGKICS